MIAHVEHCYRITVINDEPEEDVASCCIDHISAYDRCVLFTVSLMDSSGREFVMGKTDEGKIWYLDLQDYVVGELSAYNDIEDVNYEVSCSDADYSEQEIPLISAAFVQMIKDYAYSLAPPATYKFSTIANADLPF